MRYYSERKLKSLTSKSKLQQFPSINVRFCRNCPCFEPDYWQPANLPYTLGWCRRMSYHHTLDDELPYYVNVTSNDFCNGDIKIDE